MVFLNFLFLISFGPKTTRTNVGKSENWGLLIRELEESVQIRQSTHVILTVELYKCLIRVGWVRKALRHPPAGCCLVQYSTEIYHIASVLFLGTRSPRNSISYSRVIISHCHIFCSEAEHNPLLPSLLSLCFHEVLLVIISPSTTSRSNFFAGVQGLDQAPWQIDWSQSVKQPRMYTKKTLNCVSISLPSQLQGRSLELEGEWQ